MILSWPVFVGMCATLTITDFWIRRAEWNSLNRFSHSKPDASYPEIPADYPFKQKTSRWIEGGRYRHQVSKLEELATLCEETQSEPDAAAQARTIALQWEYVEVLTYVYGGKLSSLKEQPELAKELLFRLTHDLKDDLPLEDRSTDTVTPPVLEKGERSDASQVGEGETPLSEAQSASHRAPDGIGHM